MSDLLNRLDRGAWPQAANMQEAAARIREQRELLEECEKAISDLLHGLPDVFYARERAIAVLNELRKEQADE